MEIKNHFLYVNGKQVQYRPSPNHGGIIIPTYEIIHYTGASTAESALSWLTAPQSKVSSQLHLDREGVFVQLTPLNVKAWHAGESSWKGIIGLNSHSIGIECQNTGTQEYTQKQLDALLKFSKVAIKTYPIKEILGHSDIAPGRKIDPGKQFPMDWLRNNTFGVHEVDTIRVTKYKTTSDLNVREGAGTNYKVLKVIPKGTEVTVSDIEGDWRKVLVSDYKLIGWVSNKYLTK